MQGLTVFYCGLQVKADRHDMDDVAEMQKHTVKVVTENDEKGSSISADMPEKS